MSSQGIYYDAHHYRYQPLSNLGIQVYRHVICKIRSMKMSSMKNILAVTALSIAFCSCQNLVKNESSATEDSSAAKDVYVAERDQSITPQNSYSDLFLDSTAVETYIQSSKLNEQTARGIRSFYNTRNFQYAWFTTQGITEQGKGFWNLYDYSYSGNDGKGVKNDALEKKMDTLLNEDTLQVTKGDTSFIRTELALTHHFIELAQSSKDSTINYSMLQTFFPAKKYDVLAYSDSILNKQNKDSAYAGSNQAYQSMKEHLKKYYDAAKNGGWQPIAGNVNGLRKGVSSPAVVSIKKRLVATGDYTSGDTSAVYSDSLMTAIKSYQQRHGLMPTGMINDSLIRTLNVPVEQRIQQIVLNMNRMLWTPQQKDSNIIHVNIPEYMLYVYGDTSNAKNMEVIVGKEGNSTMMFNGNLNQIVFSPYWNVPESIVRDEIMPKMKSDPNYLKKQNMEIVKQNDSLPVIRQLPGVKNSLGRVKFLFPNTFDIYLHDTPEKSLFAKKDRALSHGCIRVARPEDLAAYLLRDQSDWTPERIKQAMNSDKEQVVQLKKPVPVAITYYTAWVDNNGQLNFRDDIYSHDQRTAQLMFTTAMNNNKNVAAR